MKRFFHRSALWLCAFVFVAAAAVGSSAQSGPKPMLQQITVADSDRQPDQLVKKTGSEMPVEPAVPLVRVNTSLPILQGVEIPGRSGILVERLDGEMVVESGSDIPLNPASNVKIATAYAVLKTFGPDYRFSTNVWTDGTLDPATGTLNGSIYVSGRDVMFGYEHAMNLAAELNRLGIRSVTGDLVVTGDFSLNYSSSAEHSAQSLLATMDTAKRPAAANRVWLAHLANAGKSTLVPTPDVVFTGIPAVRPIPANLRLLFSHESAPMREIIKATLCFSNNFLSERLGDMLGGPYAVAKIVQQNTGVTPDQFSIVTSSGLGVNRVTAAAMMKLLRTLRSDLATYKMTFADIMPVAGVDKGTLENRFDTDFSAGSLVGKTGTLGNTDGGVSALAGEVNTRSGKLLFVIFNQRGSVPRFRTFQNSYISTIQGQLGGPAAMNYKPVSLDVRLARSRITRPGS
jgi:D-alanyl-D-alanine carboxypeptidase/D-alanyl-D-alanine-endopeptidase (penicillin-binding protein 4)